MAGPEPALQGGGRGAGVSADLGAHVRGLLAGHRGSDGPGQLTAAPPQLTVYVAYHDERPHPREDDSPFVAVCNVRADGSRPDGFLHYDDDGGFPERNSAYCELSVLRRLQTRASSPYVGLAHYRRVLLARAPRAPWAPEPSAWSVSPWDWSNPQQHSAGTSDLLQGLTERDWCTPAPYDVRRAGFPSLWQQFTANHPVVVLEAAVDGVAAVRPGLPSLAEHLHRRTATPLYNVFLGRRDVLEEYLAFLWPVLEVCGQRLPAQQLAPYQRRWAGFVAERLHGYWLEHVGRPAGVRTGTLPLALLPTTAVGTQRRAPAPAVPARAAQGKARVLTLASRLPAGLVLAAHRGVVAGRRLAERRA